MKLTYSECNSIGLVTMIYSGFAVKKDLILKHPNWIANDNKIYEIHLKKGDLVEFKYIEKSKSVKYILSKGEYKFIHNVEFEEKALGVPILIAERMVANKKSRFNPKTYEKLI